MTTELPQIQKFNGDNFHLWKFQMKIILEAKDLLSITDGSEVKPEIEDIAKFSNWKKKDAKSKMLITTALEFKYLQQIVNCQTSAEMWKKLSTIYELKSETNKYLLQQRIFEYKMNTNDNIATHISKVETLAQQMKDLGEPISDVALITKIICSLPDKYKNFITAWDSVSSEEKTLENLTARLLKEESLQDHWDSSGNSKPDNALMTFSKFNRNSTASNKQQQHQQSIKDKKKNTHCGYCKKKGHWWKECYKRKEEQKGQQPSSSARDDSCAFSAETSAFLAETKDSWIADSGATDHMTFRREWFSTFKEIPEGVHPVCLGDGKKIYAKGKGNIDILSYVDSQKINATLLDVLYIPELETNLFSISTATKHGLTLICKGNQIKLTKNSKVLVTGIKDNSNLYRIFIKAKQSSQTHVAQLSLDIWHQRMGHVNPIKLTQMFENNVFEDDIKIREKPDSLLCEACIYGKQNRKVFHASTSPNSTYPGELIYSDVCGPMSKRSPGGSLYFVSFKDDFSRFRVAYFIRHKSDVLEKFKEFVKRVRTETGNKIKRFRTDNGTEFLNKNFSDYLKSLGIVHELTAPYTPEQNGIAERDNRTIVESARCLLHGRKMPLELWAEAVNTAVYLLNRCTTKVLGNSTPYEIWYKRKPSILHLKTFGCNAYVHIPKDNRKKLDKKSIRTFFVGYTETNKNYRMWDPIARKIIISRDVIFTEANTSENIQDNQQEQVTIYSEESVDNTNTSSKPEESCRYPLRNRIRENEQTSTSCTRAISYACYVHDQEPLNYEDAIVGQNSKQWKLAMDDEFNSLMKNQTWTYVTLPSDRKAIACKWVYKIKQNADGSNKMFKARLVAKGYSQKPGLDYGETFSPVVKFDSIRTILSLCASLDMEMIQLDVKSAFLNGDLEEELYMEQPQGYENPDFPNHVCSLQKSIYGLKQSPRMWNKKFHEFLIKFDLKPSISDSCVYTMKCKQAYILLAIYVDDCLICSVNKQHLDDIVQYLNSNFEIKTFTADYFLGLQIYRDRTTKMLFLHQASYIERTLEHYNLLDIKLQSVPSDPYSKLTKEMCPKDDQEIEEMNKIPYRQTIGSLMYLMTGTRPDIAYAVSRVSQFMNNPGPSHWTAVKKIFGYLKATKNIGICFGGSSCTSTLIGFSDADFAGDLDTRKSTTGYVFMLNNGPISWCSQKQNCVSLSTTESEYIAASKATKEAIWLRHLLRELHQEQVKPTTIFCDNQSCIRLVHNPEYHKRTKHIDISYHFIRDHFQNHAIDLLYVCSNDQAADIFTKALPPERYKRLRSQLGLFETTECSSDGTTETSKTLGDEDNTKKSELFSPQKACRISSIHSSDISLVLWHGQSELLYYSGLELVVPHMIVAEIGNSIRGHWLLILHVCHRIFIRSKSNSRIIILALLFISGIESNPGPKVTRQTTLETPMEKDLKELIAALSSKMDDWGSKLESRLSGIELGMQKFDTRVQQLESSLELTASAVEVNVKKIRELESRVSFMEMKNREKNLIFYGMEGNGSENPDESRAKIKSLIKDKLQISDEIVISRCRRLSKKDKAPMLVEVPEYSERIKIFKNSFKLRDLKIFVSKDYFPSTREQRRLLIPKWKEFLNKGITAKLRDDKLIVNGTVYRVLNGKITTKEAGDINIRIGNAGGFHNPLKLNSSLNKYRKSKDPISSKLSDKLISFTESNSITIANGRTKGDTNGSFTFISERGSSVLDYFMYTHGLTQIISDMWIEELSYSDHLPTVLQINTGYEAIKSSYNNEILTRKFIWTKENVEMLKHNLSDIEDGNETDINTKTVNFTKQIYTAMESANIIKFAKRRHQLSKPWYDKDCYIMKKTTKVSLQRCRNSNNTHDRQKYIEARREYFKLLQRKRDDFNKDKNEMIKNAKDPKSFWNAIAAFRIIQGEIDIKEWFLFYKNLLNKENNEATFTLNQMIGWKDPDLDAEITLQEIYDVVKKLANGKAVGLDGIPNELLKNLPTPTLTKLKNLFNKIMSTEKYPQLWTNSIVHPIYKSGDKNNPTNYRGIALCSNISKLFTTILRNRLNNWIEKREIILENQAGFRKNRSCTDHILLLNSLIQLSLRRKRGKLYVFFVDLTKAFDTVPHDLLWQKLHKMGISNKFVMLIKNFYQEAKITIRSKGQYSSNVKINSGVLQGESLSPLLFILYMADLIELYNNSALTGFHLPDFGVLHLLMYADDIAIIGESKINLQTKINLLKSYLDNNKLVLNENKSKVMVFRNGGRPARHENWYWGDIPLTVASNIMYLGFPFTTTNNSKKVALFYKAKANTAINATIRLIKREKINSLKVALNLFDSVIKSILLYAAPVWAWDNTDIIDQIQNTFIKNFLNLPRYIPGYIVRLETGRLSLTFTTIKLIMKYFIRLQEMEENRLPKLCWNRLKEISLMTKKPIGFCKNIMDIINHCGLTRLNLRLNYDDIQIELPNILKIKIEQLLQQDLAKLSLTKTYSNYRLLYDSFIPEHYFSCNLSSALVSFIAQIRIISTLIKENHIYVIKKEDLYCKLCGGQITDEIYHFTAECGDLEGERKKILKSLPRPQLNSLKTIKTVSDKKSWAIELFNYQKSVVNKIALVEERRTGAQ
ncbi:hypothetical protein LAZ67_3001142 [Cordylochernes scorpioides]|uniref:Retrovirus-related Pol polyprotein from transposon TNT 1-94 n=1 Tax=Cordylochernes scorpioides TaxID=51811 RepID=A0ABY6K7E9_9ARAC|nr:hypothetical protein LAZ67_3001142 [Cordylochernes scorpioides]